MTGIFRILEPWTVLTDAEFLSLDMTTGNLRVRVAGVEQVYLATSFRLTRVDLPIQHISAMGMPGGGISIAKAAPDFANLTDKADTDELETEIPLPDDSASVNFVAKGTKTPPNAPSKNPGQPSGGGRGNNPPKGK